MLFHQDNKQLEEPWSTLPVDTMSSQTRISPSRTVSNSSRTTSFTSFLRRTSSRDLLGERKLSGSKLKKKQSMEAREEQKPADNSPPKLPGLAPQPQIQTFGGETYSPEPTLNRMPNGVPPVPPLPTHINKDNFDPCARTESITHRGRYSYANSTVSTLNSPRRVRRRKDPAPYK